MNVFLANLPVTAALFGLSGLTFVLAGMILITAWRRAQHEEIDRRIDVIRPVAMLEERVGEIDRHLAAENVLAVRTLSPKEAREVCRRFARLGIPSERALPLFFLSRLILAFGVALVVGMMMSAFSWGWQRGLMFDLALAGVVWYLPQIVANILASKRMAAAERGLPDALELLVVCVEAGLGLEDSLDRVVAELSHAQPVLADELAMTAADLKVLPNRDQALAKLAERIDIESMRSIVLTLSQTMTYGTPLVQALRVVAQEMRNDSLVRIEERANRMPSLLTIPMIVFIFPCIFLVIDAPVALRLFDMLSR
jgi:tight adherence protein C